MANYKLKKARINIRGNRNDTTYWLNCWPRWHDIVFNIRPKRREESRLLKQVLDGRDPDDVAWPLGNHKPHMYYW